MAVNNLLVLCYPTCSTCKKALRWLDEHGVSYTYRDIAADRPGVDELAFWHEASGLPIRRFFNTSGVLYRELGVKARLDAGMTQQECLELLATDGKLVKRPLLVRTRADGTTAVLVGFKEDAWAAELL